MDRCGKDLSRRNRYGIFGTIEALTIPNDLLQVFDEGNLADVLVGIGLFQHKAQIHSVAFRYNLIVRGNAVATRCLNAFPKEIRIL
jgi:hypothetical protein